MGEMVQEVVVVLVSVALGLLTALWRMRHTDEKVTWQGYVYVSLCVVLVVAAVGGAYQHWQGRNANEKASQDQDKANRNLQQQLTTAQATVDSLGAQLAKMQRAAELTKRGYESDVSDVIGQLEVADAQSKLFRKQVDNLTQANNQLLQEQVAAGEKISQLTQGIESQATQLEEARKDARENLDLAKRSIALLTNQRARFEEEAEKQQERFEEETREYPEYVVQLDFPSGIGKIKHIPPGGAPAGQYPTSLYVPVVPGGNAYFRLTCMTECYWGPAVRADGGESYALMRRPDIDGKSLSRKNPGFAVALVQRQPGGYYAEAPGALRFNGEPATNPRFAYPSNALRRIAVTPP